LRLYSETIAVFLGHATRMAQEILTRECGISVARTRFQHRNIHWPLQLVCIESDTRWGHFDSAFYQIALNARLVGRVSDAVLRDLLRHELAHYLVHIESEGPASAHGPEFQALCQRYGWPLDVSRASDDLLTKEVMGALASQAIVEKVKKLLALASSDNPHEAELATLKANQLILRHHLQRSDFAASDEFVVKTVMVSKKKSALMNACYEILSHFMVSPHLFIGRAEVRLEVAGTREQCELADYIAAFLQTELPQLWQHKAKAEGLQGLRAKNSFYAGIARGFGKKLQASRAHFAASEQTALTRVEAQLSAKVAQFLGSLGKSYSGQRLDPRAHALGVREGSRLSVRPGVRQSSGKTLLLS